MPLLNNEPRIKELTNLSLVGLHQTMSLADNRTASLWQTFMPRLKELASRVGADLYSLQQYSVDYFNSFDPARSFEKWAAVAVSSVDPIPAGTEPMRSLIFKVPRQNSEMPFNTFYRFGCRNRTINWTSDLILSYSVRSTSATIRFPKKRSGYPYGRG